MENPIHLLEAVQQFLAFCSAQNESANTIRPYSRDLLSFVQCIGHETLVTDITRKRIRIFLFSLDASLARTTVSRKIAATRSSCNWLVGESHLHSSPCEGITGPRQHHVLPDVPSDQDMAKLIDGKIRSACPERDRVILELLYSCGLRASEVAGVDVENFSNGDTLRVLGKGRKERLVPVGRKARLAIAEWLPLRKKFLEEMELETPALLFSVGPRESAERLDVRSIRLILIGIATAKGLPPYPSPSVEACLCDSHARSRGAHPGRSRNVRTHETFHFANLRAGFSSSHDGRLPESTSARD